MSPLTTLGLLAGLGLLGAGLATRSRGPSFPEPSKASRFTGRLSQGSLYRVWARVDSGYVSEFRAKNPGKDQQRMLSATLSQWVEKAGFYPVLLATQDPSDLDVWTFIARWALSSHESFDQGPLHFYQLQEVDEPPATMVPPIEPPLKLDPGLLVDEIDAIRYALIKDNEPKHLTGFASVLVPEFPVAASILRAKASLIEAERRNTGFVVAGPLDKGREQRLAYETATVVVGFTDVFEWVGETVGNVIDALKELTSDLGKTVQDMWEKYGGIVEIMGGWLPGPQIWMIETAYKVADAINKGKPIGRAIPEKLSEQGARFARGMQATSPFVAMIPGLGTGVAMMMNASAALALAQPLNEAALDTISMAIPGGAVAQQGFRTAATFGTSMLRGEAWDEAAVEAARKTFKDRLGEEAAIAFDAGLALARGKSLQEAGFAALYQLTQGNELADRAAHFAEALVKAKQEGRSVKSVLTEQLADALDKYGRAEAVKKVTETVDLIMKDGSLLQKTPQELSDALGIAPEIANAAQASVREIADGVRVVDPEVMRVLNPLYGMVQGAGDLKTEVTRLKTLDHIVSNNPRDYYYVKGAPKTVTALQTTVSPSALKMVEATKRPEQSGVANPAKVIERLGQVDRAAAQGDREAQQAKEALDRASRELERRRWVEFYRRMSQVEPLEGDPLG